MVKYFKEDFGSSIFAQLQQKNLEEKNIVQIITKTVFDEVKKKFESHALV